MLEIDPACATSPEHILVLVACFVYFPRVSGVSVQHYWCSLATPTVFKETPKQHRENQYLWSQTIGFPWQNQRWSRNKPKAHFGTPIWFEENRRKKTRDDQ